ncbi:hypothetical protein NP233_g8936 [Leucocoprinus birnbaumii]|uniref:NUC153 domain-containing protein n=1 Tax=Leucocoprinus birnbaumii TaxID=56174 RepID=A0AAD5VPZ2_9AGAR|nr:hypothetical protein NP233_g8936 [Leucocoprinus birnbaumii]
MVILSCSSLIGALLEDIPVLDFAISLPPRALVVSVTMSDPRFSRLKTDPRFRRPKKKQQKVVIDERFKSVFDQTKSKKGKEKAGSRVDKYGRKLSKTHDEDNLKKYYRLAPASDADEDEGGEEAAKPIDYARGEVLMESSDEEGVRRGRDEVEIDLDEDTFAELDAQVAAYAKANKDLEEKEEKEDVGVASRTRRLAVVNLDWDHVRASHLYKIFSSLVSPTAPYVPVTVATVSDKEGGLKKGKAGASPIAKGAVLSVRVYPSEFGKARMEREEREGPPAEIFKKKRKEPEEINEKTIYEVGDAENDYDEDALRRYQLERLRYYYAIVECDTTEAASHIYNQLEGTELERSANVFDLSFVPDEMTFENDPRDEAAEDVSTNYKPVEYVTDALRHSKVKLTWDEDDPERHQVTRRTLTRQEIEEADFRAYIASSSEDEDESSNVGNNQSKKDKDASRQRLRALLLGGNDDALPEGWNNDGQESDVDMQITFTPGLSEKRDEEETTLDKYQRKIREKRKKRKEERKEGSKAKVEGKGGSGDLEGDDFFGSASEEEHASEEEAPRGKRKGRKIDQSRTTPSRNETTAEELSLIASSQSVDGVPRHFDMKAVLKAEKRKGKKGKKAKKDGEEQELQEDFAIDVNDDRFKVLHEDHQFAIDPTNPQFKKTKGMKAFLEERQRRQKDVRGESNQHAAQHEIKTSSDQGLKSLVDSVKRKSQYGHGNGKRRRL